MGSIVESFDKRVASIWAIIALGLAKSIEHAVKLTGRYVEVEVLSVDITLLALYLTLTTAGTTGLILWRSVKE